MNDINMCVDICGVKLKNPVIAASGTFAFGREYSRYLDLNKLGGISVKGLTLYPKEGNPPPRIAETAAGILNSVGLQNPGVDAFISNELPYLKQFDTVVIANLAGNSRDEYCVAADKLDKVDIDMLELNISCPNVKEGGLSFGATPESVYDITRQVRNYCHHPLVVKLSPNVGNIKDVASAAQNAGADALSLINTLLGMAIDSHTRKPILGNVTGGLSGPAIKPVALYMVWQAAQTVDIPVIGMGGIMNGNDAIEFMLAGAVAVQVGTANLIEPTATVRIIDDIERYMLDNGLKTIKDITGGLIC
ncbi:dihydroorotate dehydrogenase [Mahella sp.]|uniref:dihydroorotate dehydrogenase n=1 Tax=Mahella sp. TaxID=2798721 RepID=UPI00343CE411|nr:dihydroorotate oxidase catalytic subunit [Mahella sp.]MDK2902707.1 dihydroorotate dehydrogenase catalytic subunit [Clostridiales bacterium]